jgi:peptidoglycan/xylan/chitin deacetylase (PgdA/CDA1 family)
MNNNRIDKRKKELREKQIRKVKRQKVALCVVLFCIAGVIAAKTGEYTRSLAAAKAAEQAAEAAAEKEKEEAEAEAEKIKNMAAVVSDESVIYTSPEESDKGLKTLEFGEQVYVLNEKDDWLEVDSGDVSGYVKAADLVRYDGTKKHVALTFDDGPSASTTPTVLDALEKYGCRATFFEVGENIKDSTASLLVRQLELGCEIGNHTNSHTNLKELDSKKKIKKELKGTDDSIKAYTGETSTLVRTPYGATNKKVLSAIDAPNIYWSIDTEDWKYKDTDRLIKYVNKHAQDGSIILMHDIHETTVNAVDSILEKLTNNDFEMVTVTELFAINGTKPEKGVTYYGFEAQKEE